MTDRVLASRGRQEGASGVEYLAVTTAIVVALFVVPVNAEGQSALEMLLDALRGFQRHTTYLLSLP